MTFKIGNKVAWATKKNTFMGEVIGLGNGFCTILIESTANGKQEGEKVAIQNKYLGIMQQGRTVVNCM